MMKKINASEMQEILNFRKKGETYKAIAGKMNIGQGTVSNICRIGLILNDDEKKETIQNNDDPSYQYLKAKNEILTQMLKDAMLH